LPRTAWNCLRDRGIFHHPRNGDPIRWAVDQIVRFLYREEALALDMARFIVPRQPIYGTLNSRPGLISRAINFDPGPIS
jgi:hypothetical protein